MYDLSVKVAVYWSLSGGYKSEKSCSKSKSSTEVWCV